MSQTDNQPTRQPPTEPGDWEFTCDDKSSGLNGGVYRVLTAMDGIILFCKFFDESSRYCKWPVSNFPQGYWRRAEPLEPFAPQLPVVELWEASKDGDVHTILFDGVCYGGALERHWTSDGYQLRRTHVCKWEACDANE